MTLFSKATKTQSKLRLALYGVSGSGKTYSALAIASGIGKRIAVIDTERGSASKYANKFQFDVLNMQPPYSPAAYVAAIKAAEAEGYDVVIVDSLTHAWAGSGGALEMVDSAAKRSGSGNSYVAWRDVTPEHNKLIDALIQCRCHLIATMRSKAEYVLETNERGKQVPRKKAMAPIQRDGMEYEFDLVAEMDMDNNMIVQKSRCEALTGQVIAKPNGQVSATLNAWLTDGTAEDVHATVAPTAQPKQPPTNGNGKAKSPAPIQPEPQPKPEPNVERDPVDDELAAIQRHIDNASRALSNGSYPTSKAEGQVWAMLKAKAASIGISEDEIAKHSPGKDPHITALLHSVKGLGAAIIAHVANAQIEPEPEQEAAETLL